MSETEPPASDLAVTNCRVLQTSATSATSATGAMTVSAPMTIEIAGGMITEIHDRPTTTAATELDAAGRLAMPGLVNTHCHAAMTLFRGAAEDVSAESWFNDYVWPFEVNLEPHDVYLGTLLACAEMLLAGVTAFADMYFFADEAARAVQQSGIRAIIGPAFFSSQGKEARDGAFGLAETWNGAADGRITTAIAPHAPYTCTDEDLSAAADAARRLGVRVHIHAAETVEQTESSLASRGISPIEVLADTGVLDAGVIIGHGCGIRDADLQLLAPHAGRVGVAHCPKTYLKHAMHVLTPIAGLRDIGAAVGVGTDGPASCNSLDMFENTRLMALTQKQIKRDATWMNTGQALSILTEGGARVVGLGDECGRVEAGRRADLAIVDLSGAHNQPLHDELAALVYSARSSDVYATVVDGRIAALDGRVPGVDIDALIDEIKQRAPKLVDVSHGRRIQTYDP
ncbi:MAG: amidohydrolase [Acidimicrobiaceae bacterium]|nr:amidohydrolase [Acidimicrobiaceae bacterium]MCY4279905.1 amidohydrolase [Acidimicrobiaceae bacterium]MCY4294940.1 amidohydrolase [Acidimicrobiaceae bacterium]